VINPCRDLLSVEYKDFKEQNEVSFMITEMTKAIADLRHKADQVDPMMDALQVAIKDRDTANIADVYKFQKDKMLGQLRNLRTDNASNETNLEVTRAALKQIQDDMSKGGSLVTDHDQLVAANAKLAAVQSELSAVQTKLTTSEAESKSNRGHADTWYDNCVRATNDANKLRTEIAELQAALHDRENSSARDGVRIKTLEQDLDALQKKYDEVHKDCVDVSRECQDLRHQLIMQAHGAPPPRGSAGSHGPRSPAASVYGSVNGSVSSPSTDPPGLREDVVYLLQQLQMLKKFNFEQDGRFDLEHLIQDLAIQIRLLFGDPEREKAWNIYLI
jgi:uncharacterized coiled-coil DUF342 family protein